MDSAPYLYQCNKGNFISLSLFVLVVAIVEITVVFQYPFFFLNTGANPVYFSLPFYISKVCVYLLFLLSVGAVESCGSYLRYQPLVLIGR